MKTSIAFRKIILIVVIFVVFFLIISQRRAVSDQIADLQVRYEACKRHAESLATQLEVVNLHKKKMENILEDVKSEKGFRLNECELKLRNVKEENVEYKQKLLLCEKRVSFANNTDALHLNVNDLQLQNQKHVEEIASLKSQLLEYQGKLKGSEPAFTSTSSVQNSKNEQNLVLPIPNGIDEKNYVGKNSVHFQRSHSVNKNLEFRRENDQIQLPEILPGKQLIKKLEAKTQQKHDKKAEEKIVDYRDSREPHAKEQDYKEILKESPLYSYSHGFP